MSIAAPRGAPASCLLFLLSLSFLLAPPAGAEPPALAAEKYQLDNGLTVILHERRDLPMVAVNLWYHVGTREEPPGRSGFAHLFEHLMFMGTERVPGSMFDQIMEAGGGANNASTGFDRTNYYSWGPSSLLPTLLWLEADRLEGLGDAMTQEKLDLQRQVVRNERREAYDNAPYGPSELLVYERMYPVDHPYHFHVIGSHEDLVAATVDDVKAFFRTYYVPSNATLVVAGDFDAAAVRPLIQGLFGSLPRGAEVPRRSAPAAALLREERVTVADAVQLPRLVFVWHSPAFYAPGDAEMDLIAYALGEGKNGRLVRRLVRDEELAVDVAAWQQSMRLGSLFQIQVTARADADLERIEARVGEELARLRDEGPTADELARARARVETENVSALQSLLEVADRLNQYDAYLGRPEGLAADLARYQQATPDGVRAVARAVLHPERRLVLRVVPATPAPPGLPTRAERPPDAPARAFVPPDPHVFRLPNGLGVWLVERPGLPLLSARLLLGPGAAAVPPEKAGLAALTATLLGEGAGERDALEFAGALERLGASLSIAAEREATVLALETLVAHAPEALGLMADAWQRPRLAADAFRREQALQVEHLRRTADDPSALARHVGAAFLYGPAAPFALPPAGTPARAAALELADVRAHHARLRDPRGAILLLAGDLTPAAARALAERAFGAAPAAAGPVASAPAACREAAPPPPPAGPRLGALVVARPGAPQTVIRFLAPAPPLATPQRSALGALNTILGGSFTSRLNANLREDKGYTYGAGSAFDLGCAAGLFLASANVEQSVTTEALGEFLRELDRIRSGDVDPEEVAKAVATGRQDLMGAYESLAGVTGVLAPLARAGLAPATPAADLEALGRLTAADLNALAPAEVLRPGAVVVLVGDPETCRAALAAFADRFDAPVVIDAEAALELAFAR